MCLFAGGTGSFLEGFPGSSVGEESTCNAGDPGSIPGLGRPAGEWIGYPLQCFGASLVVQLVKNLPAVWETWVQSLGWEDPLEEGKATHSSVLAWVFLAVYSCPTARWIFLDRTHVSMDCEPMSPAPAGRFLTTGPQGKSFMDLLNFLNYFNWFIYAILLLLLLSGCAMWHGSVSLFKMTLRTLLNAK